MKYIALQSPKKLQSRAIVRRNTDNTDAKSYVHVTFSFKSGRLNAESGANSFYFREIELTFGWRYYSALYMCADRTRIHGGHPRIV